MRDAFSAHVSFSAALFGQSHRHMRLRFSRLGRISEDILSPQPDSQEPHRTRRAKCVGATAKPGRDFAKVIPVWDRGKRNPKTGGDGYPASSLPFEPEFWDAPQHDPKGVAQLESIRGFITALPIHWIEGENVRFDFPTSLVTKTEPRVTEGKTLMSEADAGIGRG